MECGKRGREGAVITKGMTVLEVITKYPETRKVFDAYGERYGTCISCRSLFSTLEEAAAVEGITLEDFLADLKRAAGTS